MPQGRVPEVSVEEEDAIVPRRVSFEPPGSPPLQLRFTPDANVLVRAHPRSRSTGRKLIVALIEGSHKLLPSNEIRTETIEVLRYPRLQKRFAMSDEELYDYAEFLRQVSQTVLLSHPYHAPLRDADDLDVLQTAERGAADVLCTNDKDSRDDPAVIGYCAARGIEVCHEDDLLTRLVGDNH